MNFTIAMFVVLIEAPTYAYISISALIRYLKYRYAPDAYLFSAFSIALIPSIFRAWANTLSDSVQVLLLYRFLNTFLMIEIFMFLAAFSLYYTNKFDLLVVVFAFITGLLAGAFVFSPSFHVVHDNITDTWNAVYDTRLFLLIGPLILIAFTRILQPLIRRAKTLQDSSDKSLMIMMSTGIAMILFWGILTPFTSNIYVRNARPIIFALGWLIWFLASQRNPFFLSISGAKPVAIFISNPTGHVYASYEFVKGLDYQAELIVPLFQALNSMASEIFKAKGITAFNIGDYDALKISKGNFDFYLITHNSDITIIALFNYFTKRIYPLLEHIQGHETIDISSEVNTIFSKIILKHTME